MQYSIKVVGMEGLLRKYSNLVGDINFALMSGMEQALNHLKTEILKRAPESSGNLKHNIKSIAPVLLGDMVHGELNINPIGESGRMYGRMMEVGSEPNTQRMPPELPISIWMETEGIDPELLYPIRLKIKEEGYSGFGTHGGKWFVRDTLSDSGTQAEILAFFTNALKRVS